jgi:hypothetical protein
MTQPESEEVRPERFLKNGKPNPDIRDSVSAFGCGRKVILFKHTMCHETLRGSAQASSWLECSLIMLSGVLRYNLMDRVKKYSANQIVIWKRNQWKTYIIIITGHFNRPHQNTPRPMHAFSDSIEHPPSPDLPSWAVSVANSRAREKM